MGAHVGLEISKINCVADETVLERASLYKYINTYIRENEHMYTHMCSRNIAKKLLHI